LCRDSYAGMALLLDRMAETGESISALTGALPRYSRRLGTVPFEHGRLGQMMQALEDAFPGSTADRTDGLKIGLAGGWVHVRASNTEPIMRLAVETREQGDTDALYGRVLQLLG
jgi:phosphomannomutase